MMVVEQIAEQEGLSATQDEIDGKVEELARHGRTPSEVWIQLEKSGQLEVLEREITEDKVFASCWSRTRSPDAVGTRLAVVADVVCLPRSRPARRPDSDS
jgi:FKBP-type peptidyl-prolyl cis-trans isomerase (trigger factor)